MPMPIQRKIINTFRKLLCNAKVTVVPMIGAVHGVARRVAKNPLKKDSL